MTNGWMKRGLVPSAVLCLVLTGLTACGSSKAHNSSTAGTSVGSAGSNATNATNATNASNASTITLGYVGDLTGVSSSNYADGPGGAQARIDVQNAEGGVNGHKLKLIVADTQSSPTTEVTAVQDLISKGVFGIITSSSFSFAGAKAEHAAGIPESAVCPCGPVYAQPPYDNLFTYGGAAAPTIFNGQTYTTTVSAQFLKDVGVTKLAGFGYGISVASIDSVKEVYAAAKTIDGPTSCYTNYSVPFGAVDFTASVLALKGASCNGAVGSFVESSDVALSQALKTEGIKAVQLYFTGYDDALLSNPSARSAFQGAYAMTGGPNFTSPNAPTQALISALRQYDPSYKGSVPDLGLWGSYVATDLMIKGLELAGPNPTRQGFITNLRQLGSYNAGGLLPTTVSFQNFGTMDMVPKHVCAYFMQDTGDKFVVYKNAPICGSAVWVPGLS